MGAGLTLLRAWANAGTRIKPTDGKIDQGWLAGEQPPMEYENERMYSRDTLINQIINYLNSGVPISDLTDGVVTLDNSRISVRSGNPATNTEIITTLTPGGMEYERGTAVRGDSIGGSVNDASHIFDLSGFTWTLSGDSSYWYCTPRFDTWIPYSEPLLTSFAPYSASIVGSTGSTLYVLNVYEMICVEYLGNIRIQTVYVRNIGSSPEYWSNLRLIIRAHSR